jgi:hypothetical protein
LSLHDFFVAVLNNAATRSMGLRANLDHGGLKDW